MSKDTERSSARSQMHITVSYQGLSAALGKKKVNEDVNPATSIRSFLT